MNDTLVQQDFDSRCQNVLQVAKHLFQSNPDWVTFFREVLGIDGAARKTFPVQDDYIRFEKSTPYAEIQQMVTVLRHRKLPGVGHNEPTRVITVRLPESLHEALKAEANDHQTSMNKLCISKLLQALSDEEESVAAAGRRLTAARVAPQVVTSAAPRAGVVPTAVPAVPAAPANPSIGRYSNL
jgi:predicted HicB family RNase H-like nuclease